METHLLWLRSSLSEPNPTLAVKAAAASTTTEHGTRRSAPAASLAPPPPAASRPAVAAAHGRDRARALGLDREGTKEG
ncbi:hypothetical protein ACP4OV_005359 [Aristida adscensionis]